MPYYPSNCNDIGVHLACLCDTELARVRGAALIHKSFYLQFINDPEDLAIWEAGITGGYIIVLPQTQGEFEINPVITRGFGWSEETLMAYQFSVTIKDPDYEGNLPFYNSITGSRNYYLAFRSESIMRLSERPVSLIATNPIVNSLKEIVEYITVAKWTTNQLPIEYATPENIFVCAPSVVYGASFDNSFDNSFDIP